MPQYANGECHFMYGCNDDCFIYTDEDGYDVNDCGRRKNESPEEYERRMGHSCPGYDY